MGTRFALHVSMAKLKAWMSGSPTSIDPEASLDEALLVMSECGIRHLPVVDRVGRLVGMLAFSDLRAALENPVSRKTPPSPQARQEALEWKVRDVMSDSPVVASKNESLETAADRMADHGVSCLPVLDATGAVIGIFSATDALHALAAAEWSEHLGIANTRQQEKSMHRSETENLIPCADCGVETAPAIERGFGVASDLALCFDCALQRGGRWDEELARWSTEPDLFGLVPIGDPQER